ncbi:MAG: LPS assembly lipoprotein LptE [Planctomycetes bacterium]|nr:LPS assembly lipoprotein LptE [Planctomycetota bacterium]
MSSSRAVALLACAICGCGYSSGYRLPEGIYTIAVPIFRNETFPLRREVEYDVTRAVRQELESRTDLAFAARESADGVLEGAVVHFQEGVLSEGRLDAVQESDLYLTVRMKLTRTRDGEVLFEREVADHAAYSALRGETLEVARREAVSEIARRLVAELESWVDE